MCFGNLSPIASRISTSHLPTRSLAAAKPPRSGTVSRSQTMTLGFPFRIDVWTANGESIVEHVAGRAQCIQARTYIAWTHYEHAHFERTAWCDPGATGALSA